jgi:hypothetical protein
MEIRIYTDLYYIRMGGQVDILEDHYRSTIKGNGYNI